MLGPLAMAEFEGPELNPFRIDNVAREMDGHYGRKVMANIDPTLRQPRQ